MEINNLSGCELAALIEKIGYKNIVLFSDTYELFKQFTTETIIDSICNDNDRDIELIITELFNSNIILLSDKEDVLNNKMKRLLDEVRA